MERKGILGRKLGMTQVFAKNGKLIPVTVVEVEPNVVTQIKTVETDGYVTKVNNFLLGNKIKFNQRQFDALVTLVYNCGTGILSNDSDIINM